MGDGAWGDEPWGGEGGRGIGPGPQTAAAVAARGGRWWLGGPPGLPWAKGGRGPPLGTPGGDSGGRPGPFLAGPGGGWGAWARPRGRKGRRWGKQKGGLGFYFKPWIEEMDSPPEIVGEIKNWF